jgi:hypothetical protein
MSPSDARRVGVDFDGVLVPRSGPNSKGPVRASPLPGALESVRMLLDEHVAVFILTARDPVLPVCDWLEDHGMKCAYRGGLPEYWARRGTLLVTNVKLPAAAYIDDRAICFSSWPQALGDLAARLKRTA